MSGFGGFGSSPFGSSNQQQSSTFGNNNGGFGNTPAAQSGFGFTSSATTPAAPSFGFGSSATIPGTGFFGSGGVTSPTQPFGTSSFSSPQPSFGTSSSVSPFATATATTPQAPFGTSTATGSSGLFGTNTSIAVAPTASNGFGGPSFLSSQPPPNPGFGTSTQVPTAGPFGGTTFGSQGPLTTTTPNPAPFFAAPPAPTGSSFTQSTQPFGSSLTFGTSSTFGQQSFSTNPFGNNASNGPTSSSIFGGSNSVAPSGFGTNNNTNSSLPFGSNGGVFGVTGSTSVTTTQATGLLGTSSNVNPFGSSTNTTTPQFGTAPTNNLAATFGTSNSSISTPAAPFGSTSSATPLFGTSPFNQQQSNNLSSPFGMSNQQQPASAGMTFSSSNGASGFMSTNNTFGSTSVAYPLFNTPSQSDLDMRTSPVPTTMSPLNTSPMRTAGGQSDSEDMGDADDGSKAPLANLPFGRPVAPTSTTTTGTWGSSTGNNPFASNTSAQSMPVSTPFGQSPALSSIPESEAIMDSTQDQIPVAAVANSELLRLKAKLELKKKKLKEKQLKEESSQQVPSTSTSTSGLSQADRTAIRFAKNNTVTAPLTPPTFQATSDIAPGAIVTSTNREELENAVSLVGTCMRMCPDEEIERRERESDIQLLEKPLPGTIHPTGWTIRETMVKRFRRSAADYKLDVPEWVRPPDVLEVVCGYLEEWVMVRLFLLRCCLFRSSQIISRTKTCERNETGKVLINDSWKALLTLTMGFLLR
jgi:SAC3/GANP family